LRFVLLGAAKFADDPLAQNLISLKPGFSAGNGGTATTGWAAGVFLTM